MADKLRTQNSLHGRSYTVEHIPSCMKQLDRFTSGVVFPNYLNRLEKRYKFTHRVFYLP